ncbi:MAG: macro domain-containing protein [candidate division WOR-3 bacterium]|nr:MAG: macro domain-containing protein [candidate division WOR-3 bacterium]
MSDPRSAAFGLTRVLVVKGDITTQKVDALVNAANNRFWMGGGVAGAIKRAGGSEIETQAMAKGPVEPGNAVTTSAGRLAARYCIHAAVMGQDLATDRGLIFRATASALAEAARLELDSVAFPALGTGVGGFGLNEAAGAMLEAVKAHARTNQHPAEVRLVLFTQDAYDAFGKALGQPDQ